jgi:GH15 family glucan-1,4-alpha-glucosidase
VRDATAALATTERFWTDWTARGSYRGTWQEPVNRSLLTLTVLTYAPTGGIVAAPTTSLPEQIGGERNWDFREWLLRAVAGSPGQIQIMYGVAGERRLTESEVPWLQGFDGSRPVRIGNAAAGQLQPDVYGELLDATYQARRAGLARSRKGWNLSRLLLLLHLETVWQEPMRGSGRCVADGGISPSPR